MPEPAVIFAGPPPASIAGIITATSTVILALGGLVSALAVLLPILRTTKANAASIAENQKVTTAKLGVIHTLVNSTLTAAMQSELAATRREVMLLEELMTMRTESGHSITEDQTATLGAARRRVSELAAAMRDRVEQTRQADIQIETERDRRHDHDQ